MKKLHIIVFITSILAYIYYTYNYMQSFGGLEASGNITYCILTLFCLDIFLCISGTYIVHNNFRIAWVCYLVFILLCIPFGNVMFGPSVLHILFPVISFFFFYRLCYNNNALRICTFGFIALFIFASYYFVHILRLNGVLIAGFVGGQSNLIYWPFMIIPFILLLEDKWYKIALMIIITALSLLSLKRGAMIEITIIWAYYLFKISSGTKRKKRLTIAIIISFVIISSYMQMYTDVAIDRFNSMKTDEGSGRYEIWKSLISNLNDNSIFDWVLGNGEGSIKVTGHTSGHNDFLHILFQYGIVGALLYLTIIITAVKRFLSMKNTASNYKVSYFASISTAIIIGMISDLWVSYCYFTFITAYWGCIEGTIDRNNRLLYIKNQTSSLVSR